MSKKKKFFSILLIVVHAKMWRYDKQCRHSFPIEIIIDSCIEMTTLNDKKHFKMCNHLSKMIEAIQCAHTFFHGKICWDHWNGMAKENKRKTLQN